MTPRPWKTCPECKAGSCTSAYHFAGRQGVILDGIDRGALAGDRFPSEEDRRRVALEPLDRRDTSDLVDCAAAELRALDLARAALEDKRDWLTVFVRMGRMHLAGKTELEIARAFDRDSHSWASERFAELRHMALRVFTESGAFKRFCKRPSCGEVVPRVAPTGRIALYCSDRCARAHAQAMYVARKRCVSISLSIASRNSGTRYQGRGLDSEPQNGANDAQ